MKWRARWRAMWRRFLAWQAVNRAAHEKGGDSACCAHPERQLAAGRQRRRG